MAARAQRRIQLGTVLVLLRREFQQVADCGESRLGVVCHQTSAAIRRSGARRIETWLKNRKVKNAAALAETAVEAAKSQHTALPGETLAAAMGARIAKGVLVLDEEIAELDALIEARFNEHRHATVIRNLPGMGTLLGAEFIAATGTARSRFTAPTRSPGRSGADVPSRPRQPP